ncbi:MAG: hypothetical protein KF862_01170 [Chitinophagaceae bacterium]|nr:hypothetical protein [Chitinophagaceae bacterium]
MKTLIFISSFFIWTTSFGQFDKYAGTWISDQQDCMLIQDTTNKYDNSNMLCTIVRDEGMALFIYGDTLSFQKRYYSSATNYEKLYIDRYDLKIIKSSDTTIIVKPVSKFSKQFLQDRSTITFKRQSFVIDTSIKFEKIVFHTTECFGTCPVYHLQVDNSKQVKLNAQVVYTPRSGYQTDTASQGYFTGQLSDTAFEKLIKAVQTFNLRTLKMNNALCCDGSINTIIVYFNGQRKYFKTMFPPTIANELIRTLYDICNEGGLTKTNEKFKVEE